MDKAPSCAGGHPGYHYRPTAPPFLSHTYTPIPPTPSSHARPLAATPLLVTANVMRSSPRCSGVAVIITLLPHCMILLCFVVCHLRLVSGTTPAIAVVITLPSSPATFITIVAFSAITGITTGNPSLCAHLPSVRCTIPSHGSSSLLSTSVSSCLCFIFYISLVLSSLLISSEILSSSYPPPRSCVPLFFAAAVDVAGPAVGRDIERDVGLSRQCAPSVPCLSPPPCSAIVYLSADRG